VAALVLSFTDFDLYGVADPRQTCGFIGLANYRRLVETPVVLDRARQHRVLRDSPARRCRSPSRSARRCCSTARPGPRARGVFSHGAVFHPSSPRSSRSP